MSIPNPYPNIADKEINDAKTWSSAKIIDELQPALDTEITCKETYEDNIVTFNNLTNKEIISLDCEILPIQEGTGTPSPSNPRPISGTDELTLKRDNENMLVMSTFDFTIQGERFYTTNEGNVIVNGSNTRGISSFAQDWKDNLTFTLPKGTFYFKATNLSNSTITIRRKSDNYKYTQTYGTAVTFTLDEETELFIGIYIPENKSFDNVECNFMISVDNITYDVPNRETYTVNLGQTVYGGTADVVGGSGESEWGYIASYNGETITEPWLSSIDAYAEGTLPSTGAEVVYKLATPTAFTFTGQPINSLRGVNNVWADSGNIKVTTAETETIGNILKERGILP